LQGYARHWELDMMNQEAKGLLVDKPYPGVQTPEYEKREDEHLGYDYLMNARTAEVQTSYNNWKEKSGLPDNERVRDVVIPAYDGLEDSDLSEGSDDDDGPAQGGGAQRSGGGRNRGGGRHIALLPQQTGAHAIGTNHVSPQTFDEVEAAIGAWVAAGTIEKVLTRDQRIAEGVSQYNAFYFLNQADASSKLQLRGPTTMSLFKKVLGKKERKTTKLGEGGKSTIERQVRVRKIVEEYFGGSNDRDLPGFVVADSEHNVPAQPSRRHGRRQEEGRNKGAVGAVAAVAAAGEAAEQERQEKAAKKEQDRQNSIDKRKREQNNAQQVVCEDKTPLHRKDLQQYVEQDILDKTFSLAVLQYYSQTMGMAKVNKQKEQAKMLLLWFDRIGKEKQIYRHGITCTCATVDELNSSMFPGPDPRLCVGSECLQMRM
jgi:hypothetical protein